MTKLYVDEIQKTGRVNKPIQVANVGFNISYAGAIVTNFASSSEVTLDMSQANYFILKLDDCTNDVKNIKLINTQNASFNSFVLEIHQVLSGTYRYIQWAQIPTFKWGEGIPPILNAIYGSVDIYNFMNVGGYTYLTQENDADRTNDLDYAIKLEDDESIITETFTMAYAPGAILDIQEPYHRTRTTRSSTAYSVTSYQYTLTPGHGVGLNVNNYGNDNNPFRANTNLDFPQSSPYDAQYLQMTSWTNQKVFDAGTVNPGPGFTANAAYVANTTVGQSGELASFTTPTELTPLYDNAGNGIFSAGWLGGEYNKRDFIYWDFQNTTAINDTRSKFNTNDITVDFDTSTGVHGGDQNLTGFEIDYNDGNGYQTKAQNNPNVNWTARYDFEKVYEAIYLQRDHPTKISTSGNGEDFAFMCLLTGTQSYTYSGNGQTYGEDMYVIVYYPGKNFAIDEVITIKGSLLGGTDGTHDILIKPKNLVGSVSQVNIKSGGTNYQAGQWLHFANEIYTDGINGDTGFNEGNLFNNNQTTGGHDPTNSLMLKILEANDVYRISGKTHPTYGDSKPPISLRKRRTYVFDFSDSSFASQGGHQFYFSRFDDGDDGGGHNNASVYTDGVTYSTATPGNAGSKVTFVVPDDAPSTLYYYNINTSGTGGTITILDDDVGSDYLLLENANVYSTVVGQNFS